MLYMQDFFWFQVESDEDFIFLMIKYQQHI